ncbi:Uncharacterised protein [Klebsiella pneumoniae]|nr:Uncharacterised protein [Klebsiella pneumoniae]
MLICQPDGFRRYTGFLRAHDNAGRAGKIDRPEIHRAVRQMRGKNLHTL